jgi:allantoin racemase
MKRLALINANTTVAMTERMVAAAEAQLVGAWQMEGRTASFGEPYISTRRAYAIASHAVVAIADDLLGQGGMPDAVLIACFGDPGLLALREMLPCPVHGMAEASCRAISRGGERFSIITGGRAWGPMLQEFLKVMGLDSALAGIRTIALTGAEIAANPDNAATILEAEAQRARAEDGADRILLGGAGMIGQSDRLRERGMDWVFDSFTLALQVATQGD